MSDLPDPTPSPSDTAATSLRGDPSPPSGHWAWLITTILVCAVVTVVTLWVGSERNGVHNPDEAHYAEQARALLSRDRVELDFVRFHVQRQPAEITHPENLYPPGNGALIAAGWALAGESDFGSALPSMLIAALLLPLLGFALALRLGASPAFAFGCAVTLMFDRLVREHAYQGLADLPLTAAVTAATWLALGRSWTATVLSGVCLAAGFWLKPAALLFAPGLALAVVIAQPRSLKQQLARVAALGAAFTAAACPWPIRNIQVFGDPLYSVNRFLTAAANDPHFSYYTLRKVFWAGDAAAVDFGESLSKFGLGAWLRRFVSHIHEIVTRHGASAFGLPFVVAATLLHRQRRTIAVLAMIFGYCLALSAVFAIYDRYLLPFLPLVTAITWAAAARIGEAVARSAPPAFEGRLWRRSQALALLFAAVAAIPGGSDLLLDGATGKAFVPYQDTAAVQAGRWLRDNAPDDQVVVMATEALRLHHMTGLKSVNQPWDTPEVIDQVVEHYGVDYVVRWRRGDSAPESNRFFDPYMQRFRQRWRAVAVEIDGQPAEFELWVRIGGDSDR